VIIINKISYKHIRIALFLILFSLFLLCKIIFSIQINPISVDNSQADIKKCQNKIKIDLIKIWGESDEADENKYFYEPKDIIVDSDHNYYVLASDVIRVFNNKREFLRKMGGPGVGPGSFLNSMQIEINKEADIVVWDEGNQRIQFLTKKGQLKGGFKPNGDPNGPFWINRKNEIVILNRNMTDKESPLWIIYDSKGNIQQTWGRREGNRCLYLTEAKYDLAFISDKNDALFSAYKYAPVIEKHDDKERLEMTIRYELPFEVPEIKVFRRGGQEYINSELACQSVALDSEGNLFVLALTRERRDPEVLIGGTISTGSGRSFRTTPKLDSKSANIYQLLVLDPKGKVVSAIPINKYFNKIRIFNDILFLIDTYVDMTISEYRIIH